MKITTIAEKKGFVTGAEIACFVIINIFMLASFGLGSSIRKAQDTKAYNKALEEKRQIEAIELAKKKMKAKNANLNARTVPEVKKAGQIEAAPDRPKTPVRSNIAAQEHVKKMLPQVSSGAGKQPPAQGPLQKPANGLHSAETGKHSPAVENTAKKQSAKENAEAGPPAEAGFTERISSLFSLSEFDSIGVEIYDAKAGRITTKDSEIAILRLINKIKLQETEEKGTLSEADIYNAADTREIASASGSVETYLPPVMQQMQQQQAAAANTREINLKQGELIARGLYEYKSDVYIGTNAGLYRVEKKDVPAASDDDAGAQVKYEKFLDKQIQHSDTIAMCGNGAETLFWGTGSAIYMIDLSKPSVSEIGIEDIFQETSRWYSMYYYKNRLYVANYVSLFYYDTVTGKWFAMPYEKFMEPGVCEVMNLIVFDDFKLNLCYAITTGNTGIVMGKMPPFDPKAVEYEGFKKARPLKRIFNRDIVVSKPCFAATDPRSVWISFDNYETLPCELVRYDKKTERYERYSKSDKIKVEYIYAVDMAEYNDNLMLAANGGELFAVMRQMNDKGEIAYGFLSIQKIPEIFSIAIADDYAYCATINGKMFKVDISGLLKKFKK